MTLSLYQATVPVYRQILGAIVKLLDKADAWCIDQKVEPENLFDARLAPDMLPFGFQVSFTIAHSIGAIEGIRNGVFSPDHTTPPASFAGLKAQLADALDRLAAISPEELNSVGGQDMRFEIGDLRLDFTAEGFLLSFSLPNFFFHATTAFGILRMKGLNIGKRDFLGQLALKA